MADALIETITSNPYESIVADTATQIAWIDTQIQEVVNAINSLEKSNPTSPTLTQLRERLTQLQNRRSSLNSQNNSANDLMQAYNKSSENLNTLRWIYDMKQSELNRERQESDRAYRRMYEDTQRDNQNYINALWNANASENAIINANAARDWASAQSTAEMRARNYLNNAQAQYEAANTARNNLNNIEQARLTANQWYTQLSQWNADNYLRQQAMYDLEAAEAERQRQALYWWGGNSYSRSNKTSYNTNIKNNDNQKTPQIIEYDWPVWATDFFDANYQNWAYWNVVSWNGTRTVINIWKAESAIDKLNKQYNEEFNTKDFTTKVTDKWYAIFTDNQNRKRIVPLSEVWYQEPMKNK